jgi:hypothetical protein
LNSATIQSTIALSKLSPPRWLSPFGGLHLVDALRELEDRHVERAAAEVEHEDDLVVLLLEPVRERGRGRLVDDAEHVEAAILPASFVASRCALLKYAGTVMTASVPARRGRPRRRSSASEDHRADLRRGVLRALALTRTSPFGPCMTSYGTIFISSMTSPNLRPMKRLIEKIVFCGFVHLLTLRGRADEPLAVLRERDDGRGRAPALGVRNDGRLAALDHGHR